MTTTKIRVAIVDDHPAIRHGIKSMLLPEESIVVVTEASDGTTALMEIEKHRPDVILLDIRIPGTDGIRICRAVRRQYPDIKIIILTSYDDEQYVEGALAAGAHGYLLKTCSEVHLIEAIHAVHRGERLLSKELVSQVLSKFETLARVQTAASSHLSPDEIKTLGIIAAGGSNLDIAAQMYWSVPTAKRKVQEICHKLGVKDRTQAVAEAMRRGLI